MTVYIDVVLLENLCMNFIILFATGYLLKCKIKYIRIFFSSLIGSIYAIVAYMEIFNMSSNILVKVLLSVVMVKLAFSSKNVKTLLKQLAIFYFISFVFGGCAFALLYFIKPQEIFMKNGVFVGTYPIKIAILGALVGFMIVGISFRIVKGRLHKKDMFCEVEIEAFKKKIQTKAFIDTGNLLKDPLSKMPVIVVEEEIVKNLVPNFMIQNMQNMMGGEENTTYGEEELEYMSKLRVIPFSSLGKQNGMLIGFKADKIEIDGVEHKEIMIGIYPQKLDKRGGYHALIGLDILEGSKEDEFVTNISK